MIYATLRTIFFQKSSVESCVGRGIIYIYHGNILLQSLILSMYMSNSPSFVVVFSHKHKCLYKVDWSMMWCNHYFVSTCQFQILNNVELSNVHFWTLHHGFTFSKTFFILKHLLSLSLYKFFACIYSNIKKLGQWWNFTKFMHSMHTNYVL